MQGINICIAGAPNAGKSTLMNILCQSDISIVSQTQGTTRDVIRNKIEICGIPIILHDLAGIRNVKDEVEKMGIKYAKRKIKQTDVLIIIIDIEDKMYIKTINKLK